jgi:3-hydroxypropanoate dehydrogenase
MSIDAGALDALFREARTHNAWTDRPVTDDDLRAVFDLMKFGPTSANCSPARFVFVRSADAKERLKPALSAGNTAKTMAAPATAIVAYDPLFYDKLPRLFPHADARPWFAGNEAFAAESQGSARAEAQGRRDAAAARSRQLELGAEGRRLAFLARIAARALGIDCGPMSGFDRDKVDAAFLAGHGWKSNFLINLGHGDPAGLFARSPRLDFDEACVIV